VDHGRRVSAMATADRGRPRFAAGLRVADHLSGGAPNAPEQHWQAGRPTVMRLPAGRPEPHAREEA
jgi:hypothetical protein